QLFELRRVSRQQPVELHVEDEVVGGDPRPAADSVALGHRVEARVHLHHAEALRVIGQAVLGGQSLRIPLLDEAWIGPARCAYEDPSGGHSPTVSARSENRAWQGRREAVVLGTRPTEDAASR